MSALIAFSWIGIMLLVGMILRAKIPFLANILMPAILSIHQKMINTTTYLFNLFCITIYKILYLIL